MTNVLADIEKLVAEVANKALGADTTLESKIDALKLLTPYYVVMKKSQGSSDGDSEDEPTMDDIRRGLRVVAQEPADGRVEATGRRNRDSA